ncbi:MAG: caspase family protein [Anaerolineae bacterium]|nr:caspase family protein [Anaerolineae bacterium]
MIFKQGHALIIGIGSYAHPVGNIPISVSDAQAVQAVLCDPQRCGYPPAQVTLLHDAQTTRQGIVAALDSLAGSLSADDTFVLYYCGHGEYGEDGDYYLTAHDTQMVGQRIKKDTGIRAAELIALLREIKAKRLLLIFNACHSGAISPSLGPTEPAKAFGDQSIPEAEAAAILGSGEGRIIITASRPEQKSWIGHGKLSLFTQAVVDGLSGKGMLVNNNAGYISVFSLYEHIYTAVQEAAAKLNHVQEPELTVLKNVGPFPVALYRGASSLGIFDDQADALPEEAAVRTVDPKLSQRVMNKFVQVTGSQVGVIGDHAHVEGGIHFGSSGDTFNMSGDFRGAMLNIKSTLRNVTQTIGALPLADASTKAELEKLVKDLNDALQQAPPDKAEDAEAVAQSAEALIEQASKEKPNRKMIEISGEGLKKAAQNLAGVIPTVLTIATQIVAAIARFVA